MPISITFSWDCLAWLGAGGLMGGGATWIAFRARLHRASLEAAAAGAEQEFLRQKAAAAEKALAAREDLAGELRKELASAFKLVSADVFRDNSQSFLELARATLGSFQERASKDLELRGQSIREVVRSLTESLKLIDGQLRQVEKERVEAYAGLSEQVKALAAAQARLQGETANLVGALKTPAVRGRWGEIQLRRVVELAGMLEHCDFVEQKSVSTEGGRLRPDLVVRLPNHKNVVVDSKAALHAYLEAMEARDEKERDRKLKEHARQVRVHMGQLAGKAYWEQFQPSPEFVVLFLPGENFFSAALAQDPELIEYGVARRVILATPTTLIALLRAVSSGWRQEQITEHAQAIAGLGKMLYERLGVLVGHFDDLRRGLDRAVDSYNRAIGSFEGRVLVAARKFKEIDPAMPRDIPVLSTIDKKTREPGPDRFAEEDGPAS